MFLIRFGQKSRFNMNRAERKDKIKQIKKDANQVKSQLSYLRDKMYEFSKKDAESLGKIIGRLEDWQNR